MRVKNVSEKIIGIGDATVLPGETQDVPAGYENSPVLKAYRKAKLVELYKSNTENTKQKTAEQAAKDEEEAKKKAVEEAENLRLARLASLNGITEEALASLANELGINPADCKDQADVLKKVKAALKK